MRVVQLWLILMVIKILRLFLTPQQLQEGSFTVFIIMVLQCLDFQKNWVQCGQAQQCMILIMMVFMISSARLMIRKFMLLMLTGELSNQGSLSRLRGDLIFPQQLLILIMMVIMRLLLVRMMASFTYCITTELFLHSIILATIFVVVFLFVI